MHITLSFHKGSKWRDTVPDKMIRLAKNIQINLRHFWLQANNLDLQGNKERKLIQSSIITIQMPWHNIRNGNRQQQKDWILS